MPFFTAAAAAVGLPFWPGIYLNWSELSPYLANSQKKKKRAGDHFDFMVIGIRGLGEKEKEGSPKVGPLSFLLLFWQRREKTKERTNEPKCRFMAPNNPGNAGMLTKGGGERAATGKASKGSQKQAEAAATTAATDDFPPSSVKRVL